MKKYRIYLFDFDGTILNTFDSLEYVFRYAYEKIGVKYDPAWTIEFSRIPLNVGYEKIGAPKEKWKEFVSYIDPALDSKEALESNSLFPETMEFIAHLRKEKLFAGIVTSNNKKHVLDVFKIFNIPDDTFGLYIGNKECHHFKPHPDPILKALEALNYKGDKSDVVYIGDGLNDTISANEAGVDAVLVDRENNFPASEKYIKISSLMELFE